MDTAIRFLTIHNVDGIPTICTQFAYAVDGNPSLTVSRMCWLFNPNALSSSALHDNLSSILCYIIFLVWIEILHS